MASEAYSSREIKETNYFSMLQSAVTYIRASGLKPGEKLPNENILSEKLHLSRSTLREVLRVLEAFGIISSRRGSGSTYLCDLEVGFMNLFMISSILLDGKPMEISNLRAVIEAAAVEEFIRHATDYDIFMLEMIYKEQMQTVKDKSTRAYLERHIIFHDQLMKYHVNSTAKQLVRSGLRLIDHARAERFNQQRDTLDVAQMEHLRRAAVASHENIVEAVKAKDIAKAKTLIVTHILLPGEIVETF